MTCRLGQPGIAFWGTEQHSYGYISSQIPELAIAVRPDERGLGIGHQLMNAILELGASQGIDQISLSVETENPALNLYHQHGCLPAQQNPGDWVMVAKRKRFFR